MKLRVVIADDEPLARERLRKLVEEDSALELLAECADGRAAVSAVAELKPDLLFLDVKMPELDGFGVLAQLQETDAPAVIFVTAYDKFALKAFEVHAVDYLLKPFDRERFRRAVDRAKEQLGQSETRRLSEGLRELMAEMKRGQRIDRLAIKTPGRVSFVKADEIDWIEADDNYVKVHAAGQSHQLRETMVSMEKRLPREQFVRISRSAIVNIDHIKELQPLFHGEYSLVLRNGTRLTLGRAYRHNLDRLTGKG